MLCITITYMFYRQHPSLEEEMATYRGAWWATVHEVAKRWDTTECDFHLAPDNPFF